MTTFLLCAAKDGKLGDLLGAVKMPKKIDSGKWAEILSKAEAYDKLETFAYPYTIHAAIKRSKKLSELEDAP